MGEFRETFTGKTPLDVYKEVFALHKKINALRGIEEFSPSLVFEQIQRAVLDLQQVVKVVDCQRGDDKRSLRYMRSAAYGVHPGGGIFEATKGNLKPTDAFNACLKLREGIGRLMVTLGHPKQSVAWPGESVLADIKPSDVFVQTQYILSEINLLKEPLGIRSSTPLSIPTQGKKPSDVCHQADFSLYMIERLIWNYDNKP